MQSGVKVCQHFHQSALYCASPCIRTKLTSPQRLTWEDEDIVILLLHLSLFSRNHLVYFSQQCLNPLSLQSLCNLPMDVSNMMSNGGCAGKLLPLIVSLIGGWSNKEVTVLYVTEWFPLINIQPFWDFRVISVIFSDICFSIYWSLSQVLIHFLLLQPQATNIY